MKAPRLLAALSLTATLYETRLSYDLAFDAQEGRLERIGPTTRRGAVLFFNAQPTANFLASISATYVHATLDSPPPASADNPSPPYVEGQFLPFVPPLTLRADLSYSRELFQLRHEPVALRAGFGATFLSPRPLPYGQYAQPVFLADASLSLKRSFLELGVDATNLLNAQYADSEYVFVSNFRTKAIPSFVPARHIAAGPPLSVLGHITLHL
jgi:outer membrane receptor protein involved in Fe transport